MNIYGLRVDRMISPIGIGLESHQFSFKATHGQTFAVELYDEGCVICHVSVSIDESHCFYLPIKLLAAKRYTWRVICGEIISETACFETAAELDCDFIAPKTKVICPLLIKEFALAEVSSARLYITGLGLYRATLNGKRVGEDYMTPMFNDYSGYLRYQTYDVTMLLNSQNRLEVLLGDGWYKGRFGIDGHGGNTFGDKYLLCAKLVVKLKNGETTTIVTDESWKAFNSVILDTSIYDGETRDDTAVMQTALPCEKIKVNYPVVPNFSPTIHKHLELKPTLYISPNGEQILDFGQNMVGFCRFTCNAEKGAKVQLQYGEVLQNDCFYNANLRTAKAQFSYTSDGVRKDIEPYFTFYGFRYVKIDGFDIVDVEDFTGVVLYSNLEQTIHFKSSSKKLNQLMQNSLWGQRGNFVDVPTDCPQRDERLGWTADSQVYMTTACYHMDSYAFYKKYIRDLRYDQQTYYNGDIPMYSPSLKGAAGNGGAVWADAGTIMPWKLYQCYGDKQLLAEHYHMMRDYVDTVIAKDNANGGARLITFGFTFGDWLAQDGVCEQALMGGTDTDFIMTIYYKNSLELVAKAARVLGFASDEKYYSTLAQEAKSAILNEFFAPTGRFSLDTQTAYVLSLYYGVYINKKRVIEGFTKRLSKDFYRMKSGFTGTPLMLPVLFENGMADDAYRILFNEQCPSWFYAINLGATTIWERWNSILPDGNISGINMNSLNHYAYGSVSEAVYANIAGLKPLAAGWTKALIAPLPNHRLMHAEICFNSPKGTYVVSWKITDTGELELDVEIPHGACAQIVLPEHPTNAQYHVHSGKYHYSYRPKADYLHPFSENSIALDLLANEKSTALLKEKLPLLYAKVSGENQEFLSMRLCEMAYISMLGTNPEQIAQVGELLRNIDL